MSFSLFLHFSLLKLSLSLLIIYLFVLCLSFSFGSLHLSCASLALWVNHHCGLLGFVVGCDFMLWFFMWLGFDGVEVGLCWF